MVQLWRQARLARIPPIDVPAIIHLELKPQRYRCLVLTGCRERRDHPNFGLHALHPERGVGIGSGDWCTEGKHGGRDEAEPDTLKCGHKSPAEMKALHGKPVKGLNRRL